MTYNLTAIVKMGVDGGALNSAHSHLSLGWRICRAKHVLAARELLTTPIADASNIRSSAEPNG